MHLDDLLSMLPLLAVLVVAALMWWRSGPPRE